MNKNSVKSGKKPLADSSSQRSLAFSGIRDNIILMKDNSSRLVLKCSSINFLLKSSEEQDSIIVSFQRFLNTLKFPIQILIRSKKLDIDSYLQTLQDKALKQKNPLLQNQTYEYIEYLKKLIEVAQIMKKEFYIIIPYDSLENMSVRDTTMFGPFKQFWNSIFNS
jgi:type IV secretory pathway VirB4 component